MAHTQELSDPIGKNKVNSTYLGLELVGETGLPLWESRSYGTIRLIHESSLEE